MHTVRTPWGVADEVIDLANGCFFVGTESHGGMYVPPNLIQKMPAACRSTPSSKGGWFEEDADIALPAALLGSEAGFNEEQVKQARTMILKDRERERPYLSKLVPAGIMAQWEAQ